MEDNVNQRTISFDSMMNNLGISEAELSEAGDVDIE